MKWIKGNVSDVLFAFGAITYFLFRDKNSDYSSIADVLVVGVLVMIATRYFFAKDNK